MVINSSMLTISSPDSNSARRCYSCSNSYNDDVRFCPKDGTDLEYGPPPLEETGRDFAHPRRWTVASILFALLLVSSAFMFDAFHSEPDPAASVGGIAVRTTPAGAIVYLDGSQVGVTPMRLSDIPAGRHEVRVVFPGYSDGRANVEILPSSTHKLIWDLAPLKQQKRNKNRYLAEATSPQFSFKLRYVAIASGIR